MNNLLEYLDYHHEIDSIIVMIMEEKTLNAICEMHKIVRFKNVRFMTKNQLIKKIILKDFKRFCDNNQINMPNLSCDYPNSFINSQTSECEAIYFDALTTYEDIISLSNIAPKYLLGCIWSDDLPYYEIWEHYRLVSDFIYIERWSNDNRVECIDWTKNPYNNIELSIIFPVYNVETYLEQCISTVTAWKAEYIEFIFVNDGSPDHSKNIILEHQKSDPRIVLINKENGGCASARKEGLEHAHGRYIGFVDPDDFIDEMMFRKLLRRALVGSYQICYCGYNDFYENSKTVARIPDMIYEPYSLGTCDLIQIQNLIIYCKVAIWRGIYRYDFLKENHITFQEKFKRFDDLPFKIEVFAKAKSVVAVPEYLYYYRLEREGQDVSCNDERLYVHFEIFSYLDKVFEEIGNSRLLDYLQICKLQTHKFAISKIASKFLREYCRKACKDLMKNSKRMRSMYILKKYSSAKDSILYFLFVNNNVYFLKYYIFLCKKYNIRKIKKANKTLQKLMELAEGTGE